MFQIISLVLPVLISGFILIFVLKRNYLKFLEIPLDHNLKIKGVRLFGNNKTYKGVVVFVTTTLIISYLFYIIYKSGGSYFVHPVFERPISTGLIYSLSYVGGELVNSAVKRRLRIKPGSINFDYRLIQKFFDLADGIIMISIMLTIFTIIKAEEATIACVIGIFIHFLTDRFMQKLNLKKQV